MGSVVFDSSRGMERRPVWQILLATWGALALFAVAHDQVTARVCPEYFTVAHPDNGLPGLFHSPSPTVLGLAWGLAASLGPGLLAGVMLALCARAGRRPPIGPRRVFGGTLAVLAVMALAALGAGVLGYQREPDGGLRAFMAVVYAHRATYVTGAAGMLGFGMLLFRMRRQVRAGRGDQGR